jgi:ABC-2 type transport system permease protein
VLRENADGRTHRDCEHRPYGRRDRARPLDQALALFFAGLATLGCGWAHSASPVTAGALGALIAMYLFDLLGKLADVAEPLRYVSVFRYYGAAVQDGIDPLAFGGVTVVAALLALAGALAFERRDVR